ncbi:MAG: hypothetical protein ACRED2_04475 [Methylocella sp.]
MPGTIEHRWHGDKTRRALKRNSYGVPEFAGNKPDLERMFDK